MPLRLIALLFVSAVATSSLPAAPAAIFPVREARFTESLNGDWSFKCIGSPDAEAEPAFPDPSFDVSTWKTIRVPGNWEMQGFSEPRYATYDLHRKLRPAFGLYRRAFQVPDSWIGDRRVILRFEGVQNGFEVWVNGRKIGSSSASASAFNPHSFDITEALHPGSADQLLAVRVATHPLGWEFDINDDWTLSGIMRDVTLFSVPELHVSDLATATQLASDGSAGFTVSVQTSRPEGTLTASLIDPEGNPVAELPLQPASGSTRSARFRIASPRLWTAETPHLYRLRIVLADTDGTPLQTIEERIGLREITIAGEILRLNGRPIKLRGVNRHDLEPATGRTVTEDGMRRDITLMKRANINYVRTSHYPPHPRFLELCDELGLYVMCEVPLGHGAQHHGNAAYRDTILARTRATIERDKNHASVIIWSIGNENPISKTVDGEAAALAKHLDTTRPICVPKVGSYFAENYKRISDHIDIFAPHYPTMADMESYASKLDRPVIFTEFAHAQGLRLDRFQDQWEIMQATPCFAGGSIWHFQDQGILRHSGSAVSTDQWTSHVWLDANTYLDTENEYGSDGIVYADRTPQPAYWLVRKVYAPVQIPISALDVRPGARTVSLPVENRHDFISLDGMKLAWRVMRNNAALTEGAAPLHARPHASETVELPLNLPADLDASDVLALELRCLGADGEPIVERSLRLDIPSENRAAWPRTIPASPSNPRVTESTGRIEIALPHGTIAADRVTGSLSIHDENGTPLVLDLRPHAGRKHSPFEDVLVQKFNIWNSSLLDAPQDVTVDVTRKPGSVTLRVGARHPRPGSENEALVGAYEAEITSRGVIRIRYDYVPENATGHFPEAGLSVILPADDTEFRWIGQGPWSGYPGMDRHNEFGIHHLNREDIRFEGNRRGVELALLTTPAGRGLALTSPSPSDVAVARDGDKTLLRHNALLSSVGNKNFKPETCIDAAETPHVAGEFTLVLLEDAWPWPLKGWFGPPSAAKEVSRPFHHSYDR